MLRAKKSKYLQEKIEFKRLFFSTCCVDEPDWYVSSLNATYLKKEKAIKFYNIVLYIKNIPFLYLPYLYVSFNKVRKSGLLKPYIGFSQEEGFLYSQPIYFATSVNSDLEITPTIRTSRGEGIYSIFRFVDSPNSYGEIKGGFFKDRKSYFSKNSLAYQKHFGYNFLYKRDFSNSKLYMDLKYANDVDYFYLDAYNYKFNTVYLSDKIITSKINYIYPLNNKFFGIYISHFIDTSKTNNDETWQIYPQLNYHKFLSKFKNFYTTSDFTFSNFYRNIGSNFILADFSSAISFYKSIKEYLNIKLSENVNGGYGYYPDSKTIPNSRFFYLNTQLSLYTSLTKKKKNFFHILSPSLLFNLRNFTFSKIYSELMNAPELQNYLTFVLYQNLVFKNIAMEHKFDSTYYIDSQKFSEIENDLQFSFKQVILKNNNKYSTALKQTTYNYFNLFFQNNIFNFSISHIYQKDISKTFLFSFGYNFNYNKKAYLKYSYDLIYKYIKYYLLGLKLNKKCWNYDISIKNSRIPILEEDGLSYKKNLMLNININLIPLGGVNQSFLFKGN
jgi:LPS-assembly protein